MSVLAVPDELARQWTVAVRRATQRADQTLLGGAVDVHLLAGERRTPAIRAAAAIGLKRTETTPQQDALEQLDVGHRGGHRHSQIRRAPRCSFLWIGPVGGFAQETIGVFHGQPGHERDLYSGHLEDSYIQNFYGFDRLVMIGTSVPQRGSAPLGAAIEREEQDMESLTTGTFVGAGSFRCRDCGYTLTLSSSDALTDCPGCGSTDFARASLFGTELITSGGPDASLVEPAADDRDEQLMRAREQIERPGEYLVYEEGEDLRTVSLAREWTRIGRSLAADVRFDDPTVSRRHALIVRQPDGVRLLDDRSLNGVFVNSERVDGKTLTDGDEIIVGRYRLRFISIPPVADSAEQNAREGALHAIG